jgi:hypothetical protein
MKTAKLFLPLIITLPMVFGCSATADLSSIASPAEHSDHYDDPNITEEYLEDNLCMFFEDLRFTKGVDKDHVFVVENGIVSSHKSYAKAQNTASSFANIKGLTLFDALDLVGIPSFRGRYDESSLTYVVSSTLYVNVNIEKNRNKEWYVVSCDEYDENNFNKHFGARYKDNSQIESYAPSYERVRSVKMGSRFDEALFILGMPEAGEYYGCPPNTCSGRWYFDNEKVSVDITTRWIESDYPMFDSKNCREGDSFYCGVVDVFIYVRSD